MLIYLLPEFVILLALFHCCFQVGWEQALYSASAGRATQHLIYSILKLIQLKTGYLLSWLPSGTLPTLLRNIILYLPFCLAAYFLFARKMDTSYYEKSKFRRKMNMLSVIILFICMVITRFGNALGNASEAVRALEEERRQISVIVRNAGDIVSINVTNYYQGDLCFEDGLPVTTHSDPQHFHGYGTFAFLIPLSLLVLNICRS